MERTYKITIKTEQDVRSVFPSERRYSASTVLGISIVFIALSLTAILMGSLIINKYNSINTQNTTDSSTNDLHSLELNDTIRDKELERRVTHDLEDTNEEQLLDNISQIYASLAASAFLMAAGTIIAAVAGLLAWKLWYIDHYIFVFFLSCILSFATSSVSFILMCVILFNANYMEGYTSFYSYHLEVFSRGIAVNTIICIVISLIWSAVASKVAYKGVISSYPDDVNSPKHANSIQVTTEVKGNKNAKMLPPDVLNHFPISGKIAKLFPKKENKDLPKAESNNEYNDRVDKFLTDLTDRAQVRKNNNNNLQLNVQRQ